MVRDCQHFAIGHLDVSVAAFATASNLYSSGPPEGAKCFILR
jgi:hypothetical protein